jgi:hypothetical protein
MLKSKYIFTFTLITFLLLSIVGAGIFVDDEWASAQQLRQLSEGHQIIYNEGIYGYYENGEPGIYFDSRGNRFMYSMALPIASLPIYTFMKLVGEHFRFVFIILWAILGLLLFPYLYITKRITKYYVNIGISVILLFTLINIYLYKDLPINGKFIPSEVLAIVTTNILLFGLFSVILHKIIDILFDDNKLKLFTFITTLSCTSLIFWVGTCKDHILSMLIAILILYYLLKYEKDKSMTALSITLFLTGLLIWARIELGVGMLIGIGIYLLLFHYKNIFYNKWILSISLLAGTIPLWINNYIMTGSPFIHPFTMAIIEYNAYTSQDLILAIQIAIANEHPIVTMFHFFLAPISGSIGLLIIIPLAVIIIPAYILKRVKLSQIDILLFIIAIGSSIYYIVISGKYMHADPGIMPDMRYFILFYTIITLFIISVVSKIIPNLQYKRMMIYYILAVGLLFILFTSYSATLSDDGTYRDLNRIVNTLSTICMGIGLIAVINDIRLNKNYLTYILPIMIAIPMAWQLVMLFIYHTSKAHAYPMFMPMTEFLYNYLFGLIL